MKQLNRKILVFTPYFYPKIGGVEEHTYNLHKRLVTLGYDITVVTSRYPSDLEIREVIDGIKIIRLPFKIKISNTPINIEWIRTIKRIINIVKPNIIMTHTPVPFLSDLAVLLSGNIPTVVKYHSGSMKKEGKFFTNIVIWLYEKVLLKYVLNKASYIICTSDYVRNKFLYKYKFKSSTITPAVDIKKYFPKNEHKSKTILFVGRIDKTSEWKGIRYLIDSFYLVSQIEKEARLVVVGGGDGLDEWIKYSRKKGLNDKIEFRGPLKGKRLVECYQKSSVLVLPSTTNAESFGMVLIEAMACKKPVIGSNIGGIPDVIEHGVDGFVFEPKDINNLAKYIIKIINNKKLAFRLGSNGFNKVVKKYTWNIKVDETVAVIEKVLKNEN